MKNTKSEIKPTKVGKQSGTTHCFGCRYYKKNSAHNKYKRQIEYLEKNLTVLFADQINQDF